MTYTGTTDINYQTRLSYTSRETSVGGMYQYRSRYYDSGVGRFAQQDSYRGEEVLPPSLHRYAYAFNAPVSYTDPYGHDATSVAQDFPDAALLADMMLGALVAVDAFFSVVVFPVLLLIAVVALIVVVSFAIILTIIQIANEMGRIENEIEAKRAYARSKQRDPLPQGRWRNRRSGGGSSDACLGALLILTRTPPNSARWFAAAAVVTLYCLPSMFFPGGTGPTAPPGSIGPSGLPPEV